jgi:hypothetical protein
MVVARRLGITVYASLARTGAAVAKNEGTMRLGGRQRRPRLGLVEVFELRPLRCNRDVLQRGKARWGQPAICPAGGQLFSDDAREYARRGTGAAGIRLRLGQMTRDVHHPVDKDRLAAVEIADRYTTEYPKSMASS